MEEKRKVITVRVNPQLKFEIEKASVAEGYATVNSWIIKVIKQYLDGVKKIGITRNCVIPKIMPLE